MGSSEDFENLDLQGNFDYSRQTLCSQLKSEQKLHLSKRFYFSF